MARCSQPEEGMGDRGEQKNLKHPSPSRILWEMFGNHGQGLRICVIPSCSLHQDLRVPPRWGAGHLSQALLYAQGLGWCCLLLQRHPAPFSVLLSAPGGWQGGPGFWLALAHGEPHAEPLQEVRRREESEGRVPTPRPPPCEVTLGYVWPCPMIPAFS